MVRAFAGSIRRFLFLPVFILLTARGRAVPAVAAPQADIHARTGTEEGSVEMEGPLGLAVLGAAIIGDKKLPGRVRFGLGASALLFGLSACAPLGPQTVEPGVTIVSTEAAPAAEVQGGGVGTVPTLATAEPAAAPTEVPTLEPTVMPTEIPLPTPTPEPTETPDPVVAEAQKVVEYVEAHGSPIHLAQIPGMRLEATEQLQQAIWNRIPKELQELGPKPLFLIIPDADRLRAVIDTLSIQVEGHENKVPLAGREVVFTFMSANEDVPEVMLPLYYGENNVAYRIGAYEAPDGSIRIVCRTSNLLSTLYNYADYDEWRLLNEVFISGLRALSGNQGRLSDFSSYIFSYDAEKYDHLFPDNAKNITWMLIPAVAKISHDDFLRFYHESGFVDGYRDQIPAEYQEVNR